MSPRKCQRERATDEESDNLKPVVMTFLPFGRLHVLSVSTFRSQKSLLGSSKWIFVNLPDYKDVTPTEFGQRRRRGIFVARRHTNNSSGAPLVGGIVGGRMHQGSIGFAEPKGHARLWRIGAIVSG